MEKKISNAWMVKWRPASIDDMILTDNIRKYFEEAREKRHISQNILLVGTPGIGKTTLAKIIPDEILQCDHMYINASQEGGIDTIRAKLLNYVEVGTIFGEQKVVILDEADGITRAAQDALRNIMEDNMERCIFVLTANYKHKLSPAIKSRCKSFDLSYTEKQYITKVLSILKAEKITITGANADILSVMKAFYPDFRSILNELQGCIIDNTIDVTSTVVLEKAFIANLWKNITSDMSDDALREFIISREVDYMKDYHHLGQMLYHYICRAPNIDRAHKRIAIKTLGEAARWHPIVIDPEINITSKLVELREACGF
tara:strand:- start:23324 stop:24271 length:948 start_codon:yes stop_codon:yes gene_type:complete